MDMDMQYRYDMIPTERFSDINMHGYACDMCNGYQNS